MSSALAIWGDNLILDKKLSDLRVQISTKNILIIDGMESTNYVTLKFESREKKFAPHFCSFLSIMSPKTWKNWNERWCLISAVNEAATIKASFNFQFFIWLFYSGKKENFLLFQIKKNSGKQRRLQDCCEIRTHKYFKSIQLFHFDSISSFLSLYIHLH